MSAEPQLDLTGRAESGGELASPGAGMLDFAAERAGARGRREVSSKGLAARWRQFSLASKIGTVAFVLLLLSGIFAPLIAPYDPLAQNLSERLSGPSAHHLLGTDLVGRDVLSRLIFGSRSAFEGVAIAIVVTLVVGIPWGLAAGLGGRIADELLMRTADVVFSFPPLIFLIAVVSALGPSLVHGMAAVGVVGAPGIARLLRSAVLPLRDAEYILVARSLGATRRRVAIRHILPNAMAPVLVQTFATASILLIVEAGLGFLGLGIPPPTASWGQDLADAFLYFASNPWATAAPGIAISIAAWSVSALGDGVRESLATR